MFHVEHLIFKYNRYMKIRGNYVDVVKKEIYKAELFVKNGVVVSISAVDECSDVYLMPGIVDSHVHIESSMLTPQEFARVAVKHGTVATVSDPHEIANVMGVEGVDFMIKDGGTSPMKFYFGAPSCVPATSFETSGFVLDSKQIDDLLSRSEVKYLSEMMNFPGVVYGDKEVLAKINAAKKYNKPVDGHAPGLVGDDLNAYAGAGITTDHESTSATEAIEKIKKGIKLQIREGSAAKNYEALIEVIAEYPEHVMLCTDDCHPDDLIEKHILDLIRRGLKKGYDFFDLIRAATFNPVKHYDLEVGLLQQGDYADMIVVDNLEDLNVLQTYINGELVFENGHSNIKSEAIIPINNFSRKLINLQDIQLEYKNKDIKVILANDGDLYTGSEIVNPKVENGFIVSDTEKDILKIVVVNRYKQSKPVVGFIKNFNLKYGAIASSIAHDSHNIIAVGVHDNDILKAINNVINSKGGIVAVHQDDITKLDLPIAGLMTNEDAYTVAEKYQKVNQKPKDWGSSLHAPFMTLSFMALLVIPELKIGDISLFDVGKFELTDIHV